MASTTPPPKAEFWEQLPSRESWAECTFTGGEGGEEMLPLQIQLMGHLEVTCSPSLPLTSMENAGEGASSSPGSKNMLFPLSVSPTRLAFVVVVQLLSCVQLFATPWTAACQASLSFTISQGLLRLTSIESVMPSNHLILCLPLPLLPSIFPSIKVFSDEPALDMGKVTRTAQKNREKKTPGFCEDSQKWETPGNWKIPGRLYRERGLGKQTHDVII